MTNIGPVVTAPAIPIPPPGAAVPETGATSAQIDKYIQQHYGYEAWMLAIPELKALLERVIGPNGVTVDQNAFSGMLRATSWFQSTTQAMRSWVELQGEDPATAQAQLDTQGANILHEASMMGLTLDPNAAKDMSLQSISYGWNKTMLDQALYAEAMRQTFRGTAQGGVGTAPHSPTDLTGSGLDSTTAGGYWNGALRQIKGNPFGGGTMAAYYDKIMALANQYMVTVSPTTASQWAISQATGELDPTAIQGNLVALAIGKFPTLKAQIEGGITPAQLFDPIKQEVAKTLEVSPDAINWQDPQYAQLFQYTVPAGTSGAGTVRPMTITEANNFARSQPNWLSTQNGQSAEASLVKSIGTAFGVTKF